MQNPIKTETFLDKRLAEAKYAKALNMKGLGLYITYLCYENRSGLGYTIRVRITHKGQRTQFSTGINIERKDQLQRFPRLAVVGDEDKTEMLHLLDRDITKHFTELKITGREIDVKEIQNMILGLGVTDVPNIQTALRIFHKDLYLKHETNNYAKGTLKKWKMWYNRISEFMTHKHGNKAGLSRILPYDIESFVTWLKTAKGYNHNSTQMLCQHLKRFVEYCMANGWIQHNPFLSHRVHFEPQNVLYLEAHEIEALEQTHIVSEALAQVRDTFLFMYELSMNYADISSHTRQDLHQSLTNPEQYYIIKYRTKTNIPQVVPLSERAMALINKYDKHPDCVKNEQLVPIITSEVMNRYLKQVAEICNIKKNLSTKLARTSRITHLYEQGENQERIQLYAGHRVGSSVTHKHYISHNTQVMINRIENLKRI